LATSFGKSFIITASPHKRGAIGHIIARCGRGDCKALLQLWAMRWIAGGAFALVLGMATNSAAQSPAPVLTPITIAMAHTIDATPLYYALRQGLFEKAGLAITLNAMASGGLATVAVVGGS